MANLCSYEMKVKGRKEDCMELYRMLTDYNLPRYFQRISGAEIYEEAGTEEAYSICISGTCDWSVRTCMREGQPACDTADRKPASLEKESARLGLEIEVFSEELGFEFQEHVLIRDGRCEEDECVDTACHYWDKKIYPTIESFNEGEGMQLAEEDFSEDGYYTEGGFGEWEFAI